MASQAARRLLARRPAPTALYCGTLGQAIGALHALHVLGLRVPEDVSVVSYDDLPLADYLSPPLTTVAMPLLELGAAAVDAVLDQLEGARRTTSPSRPCRSSSPGHRREQPGPSELADVQAARTSAFDVTCFAVKIANFHRS